MLDTVRRAFKIEDVRKRLFYTFMMLIVVRLGSELPTPGVDPTYIQNFFASQTGDAFNFFDAFTGGSFTQMSVFALSITPYITSSIIIQLLTIAIPKLEEMQKDGPDGRKKLAAITRYVTVALALIQSTAMAVGFGRQGLLVEYNFVNAAIVVCTLTAGSAFLMWIGERITEKGVGNGISIVLLINIISRVPSDFVTLFEQFIKGKTLAKGLLSAVIILAVVLVVILLVVILQDGERRIAVQYSQKVQGRKTYGGQSSHIPLKVNTAGVIPVIFASSLMSFPVIISEFLKVDPLSVPGQILRTLNSSSWFRPEAPIYTVGVLIYVGLIVLFAYFYTSITFNPLEIANNMKKAGGFIPGIRPGKPTSDYLSGILSYIILIGACGLVIVCLIPIIASGLFNINRLSFGGTSLIIIAGVILETIKAIESQLLVRNYRGFLND